MNYSKFRFSKQIRKNDCAPNAIINLMKFNGVKIPYKTSYKMLYDHFAILNNGGTSHKKLNFYLTRRKIPRCKFVDFVFNANTLKISRFLLKNKAIVVAFHSLPKNYGHVFLIVGINKSGFVIVNYSEKSTIQTITFDRFEKEVLEYKKAFFYVYERNE